MGQTAPMDRQQFTLEEIVEGAVQVLVGVVGMFRDHAADEVVGAAGQYVSRYLPLVWVRAQGTPCAVPFLRSF